MTDERLVDQLARNESWVKKEYPSLSGDQAHTKAKRITLGQRRDVSGRSVKFRKQVQQVIERLYEE